MPDIRHLVLASSSQQRAAVLRQLGLAFRRYVPNFEEHIDPTLSVDEVVRDLARGKALAVANDTPSSVIVAADTVVSVDGRILGKPHRAEVAREYLQLLSGRSHRVVSGITVSRGSNLASRVVETKVTLRSLNDADIDRYLATSEPLTHAGAYAIQGMGASLVESIAGDYFNVTGLPVTGFVDCLADLGLHLADFQVVNSDQCQPDAA